ncbi:MAG: enoyl-CoA hydratase-related protein [Steroidobacterales bacterium]|jgi:enoyl-CoA hydratase/carnithine racemase
MSEQVLVSSADGVCEIRLNRPEKRNAITLAMYEALCAALAGAQADSAVRAVLMSGEGAGFTAGNDLNDFLSGLKFDGDNPIMRLLGALATFGKPLLAAVHGKTVGIGTTMLLHCDLIVAARSTVFSMPFVSLGLVPEAASSLLLPRLVGQQRAAELLLLSKPFDAATAQSMGLVNRVVDEADLLSEARKLARDVVAQPVEALLAARRLLRGDPAEVLARLDAEAKVFQERLQSAEFRAAVFAIASRGRAG